MLPEMDHTTQDISLQLLHTSCWITTWLKSLFNIDKEAAATAQWWSPLYPIQGPVTPDPFHADTRRKDTNNTHACQDIWLPLPQTFLFINMPIKGVCFIIDDGYTHNNTCVLNDKEPNVYIIHVYVIYVIRWRGRWEMMSSTELCCKPLKSPRERGRGWCCCWCEESQDLVLDKEGHMRDIQLDWMAVKVTSRIISASRGDGMAKKRGGGGKVELRSSVMWENKCDFLSPWKDNYPRMGKKRDSPPSSPCAQRKVNHSGLKTSMPIIVGVAYKRFIIIILLINEKELTKNRTCGIFGCRWSVIFGWAVGIIHILHKFKAYGFTRLAGCFRFTWRGWFLSFQVHGSYLWWEPTPLSYGEWRRSHRCRGQDRVHGCVCIWCTKKSKSAIRVQVRMKM